MKKRLSLLFALAAFVLSSCVHEFPHNADTVTVLLTIKHRLDWTEYEYIVDGSRAASAQARYRVEAYAPGTTGAPAHTFTFYRDDLSLADFTAELQLPPGQWELRAWQDITVQGDEPFYNADNFAAISIVRPYRGDTDRRDAFEGLTSVTVPETFMADTRAGATMEMERPLAKYVFIATDFDKFYNETVIGSRGDEASRWEDLSPEQQQIALSRYNVVAVYPFYMPAVYNMFTERVVNSWTNMSYTATVRPLSPTEAIIAMDYVFINHHESGAQVQLGLKMPDGQTLRLTDVITVPLLRGQITYVRGKFLTTSAGSGIDIDFEFSGDINIKIP